jgi:ribosome-associated protein
MVMDEDNDDGLGGRTRDRRVFTSANRWSRPLCALDAVQLAGAPLSDELRDAVRHGQAIAASYPARDRQYRRIDKLIRGLDDEAIAAIDRFLADPDAGYAELDAWCDRLVRDGDPVLDEWVALHPDTDRQRVRTLARNARSKRRYAGQDARQALRTALAASL